MILIIGVGNILRNDDGIGAYVVQTIEALKWPGVETQITQQLHLEVIEDFLVYEKIIVVDASCLGTDCDFQKIHISAESKPPLSSSHHLSLRLLVALAKKLYRREINLFLCSIRGLNFEIGESISSELLNCVPKAVLSISTEIGVR